MIGRLGMLIGMAGTLWTAGEFLGRWLAHLPHGGMLLAAEMGMLAVALIDYILPEPRA